MTAVLDGPHLIDGTRTESEAHDTSTQGPSLLSRREVPAALFVAGLLELAVGVWIGLTLLLCLAELAQGLFSAVIDGTPVSVIVPVNVPFNLAAFRGTRSLP